MTRTVRTCLEDGCRRARVPHYSRCEDHLRLLIERVFGPAMDDRGVAA